MALGGERAHPAQQRVGQDRARRAALTEQVLLGEHEDDRLAVARRGLDAVEGVGQRDLDLVEAVLWQLGEDHEAARSLYRWILPVGVLGNSSTNSMKCGYS